MPILKLLFKKSKLTLRTNLTKTEYNTQTTGKPTVTFVLDIHSFHFNCIAVQQNNTFAFYLKKKPKNLKIYKNMSRKHLPSFSFSVQFFSKAGFYSSLKNSLHVLLS